METDYKELDTVQTELGLTYVVKVDKRNANKVYICPLCWGQIDIQEGHVVLVPKDHTVGRKHLHGDCLAQWQEFGLDITLHPKRVRL